MASAPFESAAAGVAAERLCERAILDFTAAFDLNDVEGMARVFAEDGVHERRFSDVRSPGKRHFSPRLKQQVVERRSGSKKSGTVQK